MLLSVWDQEIFDSIPYVTIQQALCDYLIHAAPYTMNLNTAPGSPLPDRPRMDIILSYYDLTLIPPGQYRPGCSFEKRYGHRVTEKDIIAFTNYRTDPGTRPMDDLETFLVKRCAGKAAGTRKADASGPASAARDISFRKTPAMHKAPPSSSVRVSDTDTVLHAESVSASFSSSSAASASAATRRSSFQTPAMRKAPPSSSKASAGTAEATIGRAGSTASAQISGTAGVLTA